MDAGANELSFPNSYHFGPILAAPPVQNPTISIETPRCLNLGLKKRFQDILEMVWQFDINEDGEIEFPEFCVMMKQLTKRTDLEMFKEAFRLFDRDGNGFITAQVHFFITNKD